MARQKKKQEPHPEGVNSPNPESRPSLSNVRKSPSEAEAEAAEGGNSSRELHASEGAILEESPADDKESTPVAPSDDSVEQTSKTSSSKAHSKPKAHPQPNAQSFPPVPYTEPHWSNPPNQPYSLSAIKNGTIVQEIDISKKPYVVFGRLPCCDVPLEHPSLSRYHAVLQYRPPPSGDTSNVAESSTLFSTNPKEEGFYVYDLGSTHGTFINKSQVQPRCYYRLRIGQMVKFGGSSRMFSVGGEP